MELDVFYILFYTIVMWSISIHIYRKNHFLSLGNLYLFFYSIIFTVAVKLYLEDDIHDFNGLNWYGFAHFILFLYLFTIPLLRIPRKDVIFVHTNKKLVKLLYWFTIVFSLLGFYEIYQNFSTGIVMLFTDSTYGNDAYLELREQMDVVKSSNHVINMVSVIAGQARYLSIFLFFYSLIDKYSTKIEIFLLSICVLSDFMSSIANGSRFGIVFYTLQFVFFYYFSRNYLSQKLNRFVQISSIVAGSIVIGALFAITVSRAEYTKRQDNMFLYYDAYIAEGVLFYDKYAFDPGQTREGEFTFPLIKRCLGFDNVADSYIKRLNKFKHMKITEVNFITFLGDIMLDFGVIGGTIVMLLWVTFFRTNIKIRKHICFPDMCLVYLLIILLNGFYAYPLGNTSGNLAAIMYVTIFVISKYTKSLSKVC